MRAIVKDVQLAIISVKGVVVLVRKQRILIAQEIITHHDVIFLECRGLFPTSVGV